jgi:hypothetical protein
MPKKSQINEYSDNYEYGIMKKIQCEILHPHQELHKNLGFSHSNNSTNGFRRKRGSQVPLSNFTFDLSPTIVRTIDLCFWGELNAHFHVKAHVDSLLET